MVPMAYIFRNGFINLSPKRLIYFLKCEIDILFPALEKDASVTIFLFSFNVKLLYVYVFFM